MAAKEIDSNVSAIQVGRKKRFVDAPPCYLQACEFQRERNGTWERGLARVISWGDASVDWISST